MVEVSVDRGSTSTKGAKPGHVWMIRLRNEGKEMVVVTNLSLASANARAEQMAEVIGGRFQEGSN